MNTRRVLLLMRHAKSSWSSGASSDHDRPLNRRGRGDAPRMGAHLATLGLRPQWVLSSDSARTQETWERLHPSLGLDPQVAFHSSLYHAGYPALRNLLIDLDDAVDCVLALGHNPGWEYAVWQLSGERIVMTTSNVAVLTLDAPDWATAATAEGDWTLDAVYRPKELPGQS